MSVKIMIQFDGKNLTIPVNPESLTIDRKADNTDIDIIGAGKRTRKGEMGLFTTTIESFFPGKHSYWYTGVKPNTCINFLMNIWKADSTNNNVARIVTLGLPKNLNHYFVINNFSWNNKAGEEEDVYFTLDIKEYKPYGVKLIKTQATGQKTSRAKSTSKKKTTKNKTTKTETKQNVYVVKKGDCLWNITRKYTGNGARWRELYDLNKSVVGKNPNLIYPGQKLTLPSGW